MTLDWLWSAGRSKAAPEKAPDLPEYNPAHEPPPLGDVHQRGLAAHRLINDPTLAEAFAEVRAECHDQWKRSSRDEHEKREELYRILQALEMVRSKLTAYRFAARIRADSREDAA